MKANPYHIKDIDGGYYNKYPEFAVYEEGKQAGIESEIGHSAELCARYIDDARKEVVEWVKEYGLPLPQPFEDKGESTGYYVDEKELQAKLKEWGIERI